jgi:hypothetical protein
MTLPSRPVGKGVPHTFFVQIFARHADSVVYKPGCSAFSVLAIKSNMYDKGGVT